MAVVRGLVAHAVTPAPASAPAPAPAAALTAAQMFDRMFSGFAGSHVDSGDLERSLRRAFGTANARERPGTLGRGRSDSVGSASSVGSQNSTGGGHKPKKGRR